MKKILLLLIPLLTSLLLSACSFKELFTLNMASSYMQDQKYILDYEIISKEASIKVNNDNIKLDKVKQQLSFIADQSFSLVVEIVYQKHKKEYSYQFDIMPNPNHDELLKQNIFNNNTNTILNKISELKNKDYAILTSLGVLASKVSPYIYLIDRLADNYNKISMFLFTYINSFNEDLMEDQILKKEEILKLAKKTSDSFKKIELILTKLKRYNEAQVKKNEPTVSKLLLEMNRLWDFIDSLNNFDHKLKSDFKSYQNSNSPTIEELKKDIHQKIGEFSIPRKKNVENFRDFFMELSDYCKSGVNGKPISSKEKFSALINFYDYFINLLIISYQNKALFKELFYNTAIKPTTQLVFKFTDDPIFTPDKINTRFNEKKQIAAKLQRYNNDFYLNLASNKLVEFENLLLEDTIKGNKFYLLYDNILNLVDELKNLRSSYAVS